MKKPVKVAVTGAAGQIGYSLLFRIASGEIFGDQPVILSLLELPQAMKAVEGTAMEIDDCAFPALSKIEITDSTERAFEGCHWALLVGSKPRGPGMERKDLIKENGPIFVQQGKALERADRSVRVIVVGNPCNTNALIAQHNCRDIPAQQFFAMTMLDENRAKYQLAHKAGCAVGDISNLGIWGNHSPTMYPDFENAKISGKPVSEVIKDRAWLEKDFQTTVGQRGAAVINARGKSSAASAASACLDHVKRLLTKTKDGDFFSAAIPSDGNSYNIPKGLMFSFPIRSFGDGRYEVVQGLNISDFAKTKIEATTKELLEEREIVKDLLIK